MASDPDSGFTSLNADDAFTMLGNETRMAILQTLGEANGPLSFTELRDQVGISQGGQFNYHLDQVVGHFVRKSDDGYELGQPGRRVIMAVQSGAVTATPVLEPTRTAEPCWYCGASITVSFQEERVDMYCSECPGTFGKQTRTQRRTVADSPEGYLGYVSLPPAGLQHRSPLEVFQAAWAWHHWEMIAGGSGFCPRCSSPMESTVDACEDHRAAEELCETCDRQHAIDFRAVCTNCIFETGGPLMLALLADTDLLAFLAQHGRNPIALETIAGVQRAHVRQGTRTYDERLLSTDPFQAELSFSINGASLTVTVDEDLSVVESTRDGPSASAA